MNAATPQLQSANWVPSALQTMAPFGEQAEPETEPEAAGEAGTAGVLTEPLPEAAGMAAEGAAATGACAEAAAVVGDAATGACVVAAGPPADDAGV